ncbi:hypothetical protein N9S52_05325 [Gammaproteobacteria bacterium]|nr:hypothetical protein [Gammaproteobacteria bacterium]
MNGPENISQFLRVPIADQPALGILRLNSAEVREYALNPGQTVRGIVADDGRSVTLFFPNQPRRFRGDYQDLKNQSLDFSVARSAYGVTIKPIEERMTLTTAALARAAALQQAQTPKQPVNLQALAALASNPELTDVPVLASAAGNTGFVDLIRKLVPDSPRGLIPQLITSSSTLDAGKIRQFMLANGFIPPSVGKAEFGDPRELDIRRLLQRLLDRLIGVDPNAFADEIAALDSVIDYLDIAKIEFLLRQEQRDLAMRFMLLFTDRPPAEVTIERKEQQRDGKQRNIWSVEVKLSFSEEDNVWGRVELLAPRLLAVTVWLSNQEQARLASQHVRELRSNLEEFGLDVARCQVIHGAKPEREKPDTLKSVGNLELRA